MAGDAFAVWNIAIVGVCLGFGLNQFRDDPVPLVYARKADRIQQAVANLATEPKPTTPPSSLPYTAVSDPSHPAAGVRFLDLPAFREVVDSKKAIVLDARPEIFHRLGHIPGAISLSREEFKADYTKQRSRLESDKSQMIAIYCSSASCEDSAMVADGLVKLKYNRVYVFKGGWNDWTAAHLPKEKAE